MKNKQITSLTAPQFLASRPNGKNKEDLHSRRRETYLYVYACRYTLVPMAANFLSHSHALFRHRDHREGTQKSSQPVRLVVSPPPSLSLQRVRVSHFVLTRFVVGLHWWIKDEDASCVALSMTIFIFLSNARVLIPLLVPSAFTNLLVQKAMPAFHALKIPYRICPILHLYYLLYIFSLPRCPSRNPHIVLLHKSPTTIHMHTHVGRREKDGA